MRQEIEDKKNSEPYLFSQAVKVHAQGNLTAARDQLGALLSRFPSGPLTGLVEGQLTQVNSDQPQGTIVAQSPAAGTPVKQGQTVDVSVSNGPPMVSVPDVRSRTARCGAERMPIVSKRKGDSHDRRSLL